MSKRKTKSKQKAAKKKSTHKTKQVKAKPGNVCDNFVKKMLGRILVFVDFLINYADPKFVSQLDLSSIQPVPTHYFGRTGDEQIVDLVFQCKLKNQKRVLAVIIFEHQSGSLRDIPRKLLKYISAIWDAEAKAKLPLSTPYFIVLRTGKKPLRGRKPQMSDRLAKLADGTPLGKMITIEYDLVDLPGWNFNRLVGGPVLRAALGMLWKVTQGPEELATWPEALLPINEIPDEEQRIELTRELLDFVAKAFQMHNQRLETAEVSKAIKPIFHEKETDMILTIFEEKVLEGIKIGEERGVERGVEIGEEKEKIKSRIEMILVFLSARFEKITKTLENKIRKINDFEKLNEIAKLAAKCENLKEFENSLDQMLLKSEKRRKQSVMSR